MDAFTIDLSVEQAERLRELARAAGVPPQELLRAGVAEWLAAPDREFSAAAARVLDKNRELYKRLA